MDQVSPNIGHGVVKAVHTLAAGLVRAGAQATVLCEGTDDFDGHNAAGYGIRCFATSGLIASARCSRALAEYLGSPGAPDLVVVNGAFNPWVALFARHLRSRNIPYIAAPHDPYNHALFATNRHLKTPYWYLIERRVLSRAAAIQVLDRRHEMWLTQRKISVPVIEIGTGFMPGETYHETRPDWPTDGSARFLALGRIDIHNKGLDLLVSAFSSSTAFSDACLTIQGRDDNNQARALEAQVLKQSANDRVTIAPPDFSKTSGQIVAHHDVICMPSRFEGFGLSAFEALAAARVVMVSEVSGLAPHVRESGAGVVVQPTVASVRDGLEELLGLRHRWKQMGLAGREYVVNRMGYEGVAERALAHYEVIARA